MVSDSSVAFFLAFTSSLVSYHGAINSGSEILCLVYESETKNQIYFDENRPKCRLHCPPTSLPNHLNQSTRIVYPNTLKLQCFDKRLIHPLPILALFRVVLLIIVITLSCCLYFIQKILHY